MSKFTPKDWVTLVMGFPMLIGMLVGIIWVFVTIFNPTPMNAKILVAGWAAYWLFGIFIPDDKD